MGTFDLVECAWCGHKAAEWEFETGCPECGGFTFFPGKDEGDE